MNEKVNLTIFLRIFILFQIIFSFHISYGKSSINEIKFINGGYESVTIAISKNVPENPDILTHLKVCYLKF
jgi:hypothetical protein